MPALIPALVSFAVSAAGYSAAYAFAGSVFASLVVGTVQARDARRKARNQINDQATDHIVAYPTTDKARSRVYGRQRNADGVLFKATFGDKSQFYGIVTALAAHEVDGIEEVYFNDERLLLNAPIAPNVERQVIGVVKTETFHSQAATSTFTLKTKPSKAAGTVKATYRASTVTQAVTVSNVTDTTVTVTNVPPADGTVTIEYRPDPSPYLKIDVGSKTDSFTGRNSVTVTLSAVPAGGVNAIATTGSGDSGGEFQVPVTVNVASDGLSATATVDLSRFGGDTVPFRLTYQSAAAASKASVWVFNGTPGVTPTALLKGWFPGLITDQHRFDGIALMVTRLEFDTDLYPQGPPSQSALMRGARVYDWRTGQTVWSQNPAVIASDWALYKYGGDCTEDDVDRAWFTAAANACDVRRTFIHNDGTFPGATRFFTGSTPVFGSNMPLYTCDIVCGLDQDPYATFGDMVAAMGGKFGWSGGRLRVRAGSYTPPIVTIDESWLSGTESIDVVPEPALDDAVNIYVPTIADRQQDYVSAPAPAVRAEAYITLDGRELVREIQLPSVTDIYHAQNCCGILMRDERNGLTVKLACNLRAMQAGLFDTVYVSLERYGWVQKVFEIQDWRFSMRGGVVLTLKETAAFIFNPDAGFSDSDATPNTALPNPLVVQQITGLDVTTSVGIADGGGYVTSTVVSWDRVLSAAVQQSGSIEVAYIRVSNANQPGDWPSVTTTGDSTSVTLLGLDAGAFYLFKARSINSLKVRSVWSQQAIHQVAQVPALVYSNLVGRPLAFRVSAVGFVAQGNPLPAGIYNAEDTSAPLFAGGPMYAVAIVRRSDGVIYDFHQFNLYVTGFPEAMAAMLNAYGPEYLAVVFTSDEPSGHRFEGGLAEAMYRCGASRDVFGSDNFAYRSAYVLVGICGGGEGTGAESYRGNGGSDPGAWVDVYFTLLNGNALVTPGVTPRTAKTFYQDADPRALASIGDLWIRPTENRGYRWDGTNWLPIKLVGVGDITTSNLAQGAATDALSVPLTDWQVTSGGPSGPPLGDVYQQIMRLTYVNPTADEIPVQIEAYSTSSMAYNGNEPQTSEIYLQWGVPSDTSRNGSASVVPRTPALGVNTTGVATPLVYVPGGQSIVADIVAHFQHNAQVTANGRATLRISGIKR